VPARNVQTLQEDGVLNPFQTEPLGVFPSSQSDIGRERGRACEFYEGVRIARKYQGGVWGGKIQQRKGTPVEEEGRRKVTGFMEVGKKGSTSKYVVGKGLRAWALEKTCREGLDLRGGTLG